KEFVQPHQDHGRRRSSNTLHVFLGYQGFRSRQPSPLPARRDAVPARGLALRRCLLALLLALVCADPTHAQTQPEVRKIRFSGAQSFDVELLRAAIISDQTSCKVFVFCHKQYLDPVGLSGDIVRLRLFYYQRGYRKATIQLDTTRSGDALTVRFNITEGEPVRIASVDIKGAATQSLPIA